MRLKLTAAAMVRRVLRPRVLVYTTVLLTVSVTLMVSLVMRTPFKVDVVRDRASLARIVSGGHIENVYRLQIMNAVEKRQHFKVTAEGMYELKVMTDSEDLIVESTQSRWISIRLQVPYDSAMPGSYPVKFFIEASDDDQKVQDKLEEKSVFLIPR
jgi:polyferredoxin